MAKKKKPLYEEKIYIEVSDGVMDDDGYYTTVVGDLADGVVLEYKLNAVLRKSTETSVSVEPL